MKKQLIAWIVAVTVVLGVNLAYSAPIWQQSEGVAARLGVRDKFGELRAYSATFSVKNNNGLEWKKTILVSSDQWGYVYFPVDFTKRIESHIDPRKYPKPGEYSWECTVKGKVISSGRFTFTTVKSYNDRVQVYR